ncbi:hypothetical protein L3i23_29250 [Herbiconiux sp. L3-i23]|nr:hypothetical protein L3i23_29250 [Herbiconiux sp. L3-i23]
MQLVQVEPGVHEAVVLPPLEFAARTVAVETPMLSVTVTIATCGRDTSTVMPTDPAAVAGIAGRRAASTAVTAPTATPVTRPRPRRSPLRSAVARVRSDLFTMYSPFV